MELPAVRVSTPPGLVQQMMCALARGSTDERSSGLTNQCTSGQLVRTRQSLPPIRSRATAALRSLEPEEYGDMGTPRIDSRACLWIGRCTG